MTTTVDIYPTVTGVTAYTRARSFAGLPLLSQPQTALACISTRLVLV